MQLRKCGTSGLMLSPITLGLMVRDCIAGAAFESVRQTILRAVDRGIISIDLAAGYGNGEVERAFGKVLRSDLAQHRDKLVIATKGAWADGSRSAIVESIDRSLRQLGVESVDLFYHHAPDANTPADETAAALELIVRQGKTRFVGISNYSLAETIRMAESLRARGVPCVAHQANYNCLNRWVEDGLIESLGALGIGMVAYSVLAQGILSDATSPNGARSGSRAAKMLEAIVAGVGTGEPAYGRYSSYSDASQVRRDILGVISSLRSFASDRGQTLSQLAIAWVLRHANVATALVGLSSPSQVDEAADATHRLDFLPEERLRLAALLPPRMGLL